MASWHTPHSARAFWKDAAKLSDETVTVYLTVARSACLAFAPLLLGAPVPDEYALAQVMHARNLYNAANGATGPVDPETGWAAMTTRPLDWHVQQLLTPNVAFGGVA